MSDLVVTGALGNVGSAVAECLVSRGTSVRVADRDTERLVARFGSRHSAHLDFLAPETFPAVLEGATSVFLIRPPAISRVGATLNRFIDVAAEMGVEHVVFSSVAGAESNRLVPHHRVEKHLERSGLAWTMLRPGFFSQNIGTAYRSAIVETNEIFVPAGDGRVAFIDARDIGEVAALALTSEEHRMKSYHLTGPEAVTFEEVAATLTEILERSIAYRPASVLVYLTAIRRQGLVLPQALVQTILHTGLRGGNAEEVTDTIETLLGRPPRTVDQYIRDHVGLWDPSDL